MTTTQDPCGLPPPPATTASTLLAMTALTVMAAS
jgi:hypothetical protein